MLFIHLKTHGISYTKWDRKIIQQIYIIAVISISERLAYLSFILDFTVVTMFSYSVHVFFYNYFLKKSMKEAIGALSPVI